MSTNADHREAQSTHGGLREHPASSARSIDAIGDVVRAVRTGGSVADS